MRTALCSVQSSTDTYSLRRKELIVKKILRISPATIVFWLAINTQSFAQDPEQQATAAAGPSPPAALKLPAYINNPRVPIVGNASSYIAFSNLKLGSDGTVTSDVVYSVGSSAASLCYVSGASFTGRWTQLSADSFVLTGESPGRAYRCAMTVKIEFSPQLQVKGGDWVVGTGRGGFLPPK